MNEQQYQAALAHHRGGDEALELQQQQKIKELDAQIIELLERQRAALTKTVAQQRGTLAAVERERATLKEIIAAHQRTISAQAATITNFEKIVSIHTAATATTINQLKSIRRSDGVPHDD